MAATQKQTLFNDPTLSDVKIKQICKGKTREYFGHKAILCAQSDFFMKAFTGGFKEAREATMEIYDDDPDHFEFALKFIYTQEYDSEAIEAATGKSDKMKMAYFLMGVYIVADKYGIQRLLKPIVSVLQTILEDVSDTDMLASFVATYYKTCHKPGTAMGSKIATTMYRVHHYFTQTMGFDAICRKYPIFSADLMASLTPFGCRSCGRTTIINIDGLVPTGIAYTRYCAYCGQQ